MPLFFLPGAAGSSAFWRPVAERISSPEPRRFFSWPGLGNEPAISSIQSIEDLVSLVAEQLTVPSVLIAQSMGGYIALRLALQKPDLVRRLVLTVASAGLPTEHLGAIDWRANYPRNFPRAANWITEPTEDLRPHLHKINAPCLLLWGGADPISPVSVGQQLLAALPNAQLHVFDDADHDLAISHSQAVAQLIEAYLE
ncbi:MAG: alpha/beta hydrolase [Pseudomonadota bacterium]|uniref:alpha/beta fold hydrolase n=1 Tax=Sphingomonas sp. ERG5 TaxID=1381597 RepID=UPI00054B7375|nr:alpha/beta hydrolase [Sphingomonas sp. ERG5]